MLHHGCSLVFVLFFKFYSHSVVVGFFLCVCLISLGVVLMSATLKADGHLTSWPLRWCLLFGSVCGVVMLRLFSTVVDVLLLCAPCQNSGLWW